MIINVELIGEYTNAFNFVEEWKLIKQLKKLTKSKRNNALKIFEESIENGTSDEDLIIELLKEIPERYFFTIFNPENTGSIQVWEVKE